MYRQYEDPYKVKCWLEEAKNAYEEAKANDPENVDLLISLHEEVAELEERLNFAWQDDEAEVEGYDW